MDGAKLDPKFVAGNHLSKAAALNPHGNRATHLHRLPNVVSPKERVAVIESDHLLQREPPGGACRAIILPLAGLPRVSIPGRIESLRDWLYRQTRAFMGEPD